jgi:hypothetical protein
MLRGFRGILPCVAPSADVDQSAQVIGDVASIRGSAGHYVRYRLDYA